MPKTIFNKTFLWIGFVLLFSFAYEYSIAQSNNCLVRNVGPSLVSTNGRQLIVQKRNPDNSLIAAGPYSIRGTCWSPASKNTNTNKDDPNNANIRRPEFYKWYKTDIPILKKLNINTIRTFMDFGLGDTTQTILDELYCNDIMVIMTVDDATNDTARIRKIVEANKNHPAILMWMIGNEWNISPHYYNASISLLEAVRRTQVAAALIKSLDTNHPVATGYGDIQINDEGRRLQDTKIYVNDSCTAVDIWGLNIYRGSNFGALFSQWKSISTKPMFLSEFGTDAFRSNPPPGQVDEVMQAQWDMSLWNEIFQNLSVRDTSNIVAGATVFEFNDEWWKVSPPESHDTGGYEGPFPDSISNEEWLGLVDIDRRQRAVYDSFKIGFHPAYNTPSRSITFRAESAGFIVPGTSNGFARFYKGNSLFFDGGGQLNRGFNIAAIDTMTGELIVSARSFDTYASRDDGSEMTKMIGLLDSLPNGTLVMIAIRDEAGINLFPPSSCMPLPHPWIERCYQVLESLGSKMIRKYCYWNSWAMASIKGEGLSRMEQLDSAKVTAVQTTIHLNPTSYPALPVLAPVPMLPLCGSQLNTTQVLLSWNKVDGSTSYRLQIDDDSTFTPPLLKDELITDTSIGLSGLINRKTYYRRVNSNNTAGQSRWSCTGKFTVRIQPIVEVIPALIRLPGDSLKIRYQFFNPLNPGNSFIIQMTDTSGNETIYKQIAGVAGITEAGEIKVRLPFDTPCGNKYRLRIISTNTADTSLPSNKFEVINRPAARIQPPVRDSACAGQTVVLNADSVTGASYQWFKNNVSIIGGTQQAYEVSTGGEYSVNVSKAGCDSLSVPVHLVFVPVDPRPTITSRNDTLESSALSGNQWFKEGIILTGDTSRSYRPSTQGKYSVQVTKLGCKTEMSVEFNFQITAIPDPAGWDGLVFIFPNPVPSQLNIVNNDITKKLFLRLYDVAGRQVELQRVESKHFVLEMDTLAKGSYLLLLTDQKKNETWRRIIIKL